jgi:hypothetical protein
VGVFSLLLMPWGCNGLTVDAVESTGIDTGEAHRDSPPNDSAPNDSATCPVIDTGTGCEPPPERWCNGRQDLCDRSFDQVVLPGTHNSMSNADAGWIVPNQTHGLTQQLNDGIRAMLLDTHDFNGEPHLCHASCYLGSQPLVEGLAEIVAFLQAEPDQVLALIFEDHIDAETTQSAFVSAGLDGFVYTHPGGDWPTLAQMIDAGTRVVVGAENEGPPPDWYAHAWDQWQDTPYDFWHEDDFSCGPNRGSASNPLFLVNHWLSNPVANSWTAEVANTAEILEARAAECLAERGRLPGVIAVDFYELGDLFAVVDRLNDAG